MTIRSSTVGRGTDLAQAAPSQHTYLVYTKSLMRAHRLKTPSHLLRGSRL